MRCSRRCRKKPRCLAERISMKSSRGAHWLTFDIEGDYAYVAPNKSSDDATEIFDAHTHKSVGLIDSGYRAGDPRGRTHRGDVGHCRTVLAPFVQLCELQAHLRDDLGIDSAV